MSRDLAIVRFAGETAAVEAYAAARERAGEAPWASQVGFVEHHQNGRLLLRGTFGGHYLGVDEGDRVSQKGAGEGAVAGGLVGVLLGPPGIALGLLVGGILGSKAGPPSDAETEPELLVEQLRAAVPRSSSAIVMIASPQLVDEMLAALGGRAQDVTRRTLTPEEQAELEASLSTAPPVDPAR